MKRTIRIGSALLVAAAFNPAAKTAVLMVNGFNGLGLHTLFNVIRFFGSEFKNFVFIEIGIIDAGNFKGSDEMENLKKNSLSRKRICRKKDLK